MSPKRKSRGKAGYAPKGAAVRARARQALVLQKLATKMSPKAVEAVKAIQRAKAGEKASRTPRKLQGKKAASIRKAVRSYYLG